MASAGLYASLHLTPNRKPRQHPTTQIFTGRMPFLSPNQHSQSAEGKISTKLVLIAVLMAVFLLEHRVHRQTNRQTDKVTDATKCRTHNGSYTTSVNNYVNTRLHLGTAWCAASPALVDQAPQHVCPVRPACAATPLLPTATLRPTSVMMAAVWRVLSHP